MNIEKTKNPAFQITVSQYGTTVTIEKDRADIDIYEYREMAIAIALALGWSQESIDGIFKNIDDE
mgnify:FL=1